MFFQSSRQKIRIMQFIQAKLDRFLKILISFLEKSGFFTPNSPPFRKTLKKVAFSPQIALPFEKLRQKVAFLPQIAVPFDMMKHLET